jgi:ADP-heptose:LPS heptosyltransferase
VRRAVRKLDNTLTILLLGKIRKSDGRKAVVGDRLLLFILENLGDTIAATPVFNMISKESWVVCSRYNRPVIDMLDFKNMIVINRDPGFFDFLKVWHKLREKSFSSSIILDHTKSGDFGILASRFLKTGRIVSGFDKSVKGDIHITDWAADNENMDVLSLSKVSIARGVISIDEKDLRKEIRLDCGTRFRNYRDFVGIHAGGLGSLLYPVSRQYPADHLIDLIKMLLRKGHKVVLTGDKNDMKSFGEHSKILEREKGFTDLSGKLDVSQLACLLKELRVYITPDNGTLHLAQAAGCRKIFAVLGPSNPTLVRGENTEIIRLDLACSPCIDFLKFPARCINEEEHVCLKRLVPEIIFEKLVSYLNGET